MHTFTARTVNEHWNRLAGKTMESPFLENIQNFDRRPQSTCPNFEGSLGLRRRLD